MKKSLQSLAGACGLLLAALAVPAHAAPGKPLQIRLIDVEGGAATLYVTPDHKSLLVDAGWPEGIGTPKRDAAAPGPAPLSSAERIVAAAKAMGLSRLDYVLVTHYHVDHVGGVEELAARFPIGTFLDHGPNRETPPADLPPQWAAFQPEVQYPKYEKAVAGHARRSLKAGDRLAIGALELTVLTSGRQVLPAPLAGAGQPNGDCAAMKDVAADGGEENARSLGVLLTFGKTRIVSLGDLTWNVEKALVCPDNKVGQVDLFFVSNHGTNLNNSPALLHALAPRVAVMGNGAKKGGDPESYDTVSTSPGLKRLWQVHFSDKGGKEHNPPDDYIANLSTGSDQNQPLEVAAYADGTLTVSNPRNGVAETYRP